MIAVDWGTSSLRVYRLDAAGQVLDQRSTSIGLLACQGRFEAVLAEQIAGWNEPLIIMAGMIGSRNGWFEVPYVACPAGPREIGAGLREVLADILPGRRIVIAPGLCDRSGGRAPEVMRGEETQILGLFDLLALDHGAGPHTICLPGTHSKWVTVEAGRITSLRTAMTGEVYAVLRQHSILRAGMAEPVSPKPDATLGTMPGTTPDEASTSDDRAAFELGLTSSREPGGLLNHLFSVRSRGLFGELSPTEAAPYLSGLLIGHELHGLLGEVWAGDVHAHDGQAVHLIGNAGLTARYHQALAWWGVATRSHDEALVTRGLFMLAATLA
ncbi:MAG: 2-dehydro-3-deoxygalactonokinase [Burkholderiales bacterium]|nr:2-dehydro-3-deoxygalactonokinase [Burkholderiales bacterium]